MSCVFLCSSILTQNVFFMKGFPGCLYKIICTLLIIIRLGIYLCIFAKTSAISFWHRNLKAQIPFYLYCRSILDCFLFPCTVSHKQQAAKDDVVASITGVTCASVIITAWLMESAAKTLNLSAPQVRLFP